jgi:hypothetical protein
VRSSRSDRAPEPPTSGAFEEASLHNGEAGVTQGIVGSGVGGRYDMNAHQEGKKTLLTIVRIPLLIVAALVVMVVIGIAVL